MCKTTHWEADQQMKLNVTKCHSLRANQHYSHKQFLLDNILNQKTCSVISENVQSEIYIGLNITENMDWDQRISDLSVKATKT